MMLASMMTFVEFHSEAGEIQYLHPNDILKWFLDTFQLKAGEKQLLLVFGANFQGLKLISSLTLYFSWISKQGFLVKMYLIFDGS